MFIANVQEPAAGIVPPARVMTEWPLTSVLVMVPVPQDPVSPFGVATRMPIGNESVKATPVSPTVLFGLVIVKLSEVVWFSEMLAAPNVLLMAAGPTTVTTAVLLVKPGPLSVEEMTPVVLLITPALVPFTETLKLQDALAARVAPDKLTEEEPGVAVIVPPPQVPASPLGVEITSPAGSESVKAMPLSEIVVFGLLMLKVSEVEPFSGMLTAPNALVMVGAVATLRFAVAVLPVPPLVEVTLPVVLVYWPETAPVTVTLKEHWLFTAMVAPDNAIPVGFVVVRVPPQTVDELLATVNPVGSVSVNATPVRATEFAAGLVMVNVSEVVPFNGTLLGVNTLAMDGGATTAMLAEAVPPVPPSVEVTFPVVLVWSPAAMPVTFTENVHDALAARLAPDRLITLVPCVAVIVPPPQVPVCPLGVEITRPAGSVSLKPTPVSVVVVLVF
jgi:hypothetical protein